jgi:membrane-associated phospholipid phosphatase
MRRDGTQVRLSCRAGLLLQSSNKGRNKSQRKTMTTPHQTEPPTGSSTAPKAGTPAGTPAVNPASTSGAVEGEPRIGNSTTITVSHGRARARTFGAELGLALALLVYAVLALLARRYAYFEWDLEVARAIQSITIPGFRSLMIAVSALGSGWVPFALVIGVVILLLKAGFRTESLLTGLGVGIGSLVDGLLKTLTDRPRPTMDLVNVIRQYSGDSFPSGHVFFYVNFFGFLFFLAYVHLPRGSLRRVLLFVFAALVILIGLSRVYMGAHWPSDVAGAYLGAGIWLMIMVKAYRRLKPYPRDRSSSR